jgi:hypothetical protein
VDLCGVRIDLVGAVDGEVDLCGVSTASGIAGY